jgi:hypothetical protein
MFFRDDPASFERSLPGLAALSSARGASRSDDGMCALHDRYVAASASCASFASLVPTAT